jgi:hypothetical protein
MLAGISGATPGSVDSGAVLDDSDGRLMLPHAPRNIVSAETAASLATMRALHDLIIRIPPSNLPAAPVMQPSAKLLYEQ